LIFVNWNCCQLCRADSFVPNSSDATVWKGLQNVQTYRSEPVPGHHRRPHVWWVLCLQSQCANELSSFMKVQIDQSVNQSIYIVP